MPDPQRPDVQSILDNVLTANQAHGEVPLRQTVESLCRWIQHLERPRTDIDHETAHNAVRRLAHLLEHFEAQAERDCDAEDLAEDLKWILEDLDTYVAGCREGRVVSEAQASAAKAILTLSRHAPSEVDIDPLGNVRVLLFDGDTCESFEGEHHESVIEAIFDAASNFPDDDGGDIEEEPVALEAGDPDPALNKQVRFVSIFSVRISGVQGAIDMMRYDQCYPATEEDARKLMRIVAGTDKADDHVIQLVRVASTDRGPDLRRWRSFNCEVLDQNLVYPLD